VCLPSRRQIQYCHVSWLVLILHLHVVLYAYCMIMYGTYATGVTTRRHCGHFEIHSKRGRMSGEYLVSDMNAHKADNAVATGTCTLDDLC
jgi:hypothetical protein